MNYIEINNCKHYFLNEGGEQKMYFIHSNFFVEIDHTLNHPLGKVYKPKGCLDTPIRFVRQPNNSFLMFKANEWNIKSNSFYVSKPNLRRDVIDAFYSPQSYLLGYE